MDKLFIYAMTLAALVASVNLTWADSVTCKDDRYQSNTLRCDDGNVWRKDRYGYETWRSDDGTVIKKDRYGSGWTIERGGSDVQSRMSRERH